MQNTTEAANKAYETCRDYLYRLFGEVNVREVDRALTLQEGTTFVYVRAFPIGERNAGVEVFSYVVTDVEPSEGLMRFLLEYNLKLTMGGFGLAPCDSGKVDILMTHTILGDTMTRDQLYASVSAIARASDDLDNQIVSRFGGKTALDKLNDTLPPVRWE